MDIVGKKKIYFLISLIFLVPGIISLIFFGLKLSIDFTGGSRMTLVYERAVDQNTVNFIRSTVEEHQAEVVSIQRADERVVVRSSPLSQQQHKAIVDALQDKTGPLTEEESETIGPVIGGETTRNAVIAVLLASFLIVLYIAWSFRKVPKPASSFRFGICAVIALVHDMLIVVGVFSILGYVYGIEVGSLFVTALLTIIGFSVHDTIVVFDRIRENLRRFPNLPFAQVVNDSILQTLTRSLNTSFTTLLVLFTLLLFGGETLRWFIVALLIGIASGTYSSIFNASTLLVVWEEWSRKKRLKI